MLLAHARVGADFKPHINPGAFTLDPEKHPEAYGAPCPVCEEPLVDRPAVLVMLGIGPGHRKNAGGATAVGIAVCVACSGYTEAEAHAMYEAQQRATT